MLCPSDVLMTISAGCTLVLQLNSVFTPITWNYIVSFSISEKCNVLGLISSLV
jgi:hypothetical protein